jgi:hypothetical protein
MIAAVGWSQDEPRTGNEKPFEAAAEAPDSDALSAEENDQLQRLTGGETRYKSWSEFLTNWMTAKPFDKRQVVRIDERYAYPHVVSATKMEIVREDDTHIWLRGISPEDPNSPLYTVWARREADEAIALDWQEIANTPGGINYVDYDAEAVPPPDMESLRFEPSPGRLPNSGRWQMGFAVADMNGDGHPDLVFPPRRKDYPVVPEIFLGDGAGGFQKWHEAKWPREMAWDYGGVAAADFNGDGHQDLAFAIHFKEQFVLYGNGEGLFPTGERLRSPDPRLTSRALVAADFDGDGRQDLGFVAEVDLDLRSNEKIEGAKTVWVQFNTEDGWVLDAESLPTNVIADVISAADVNGDGRPELVLSSNTLGIRFLVMTYRDADGWWPAEHRGVLSAAYHYDVEPVGDELFAAFVQFRSYQGSTQARNGIVRYQVEFGDGNDDDFVVGQPVIWDKQRSNVFFRLAVGDLDGDGLTDLVAGRNGGGLEAYLQTEDGYFYLERGSELEGVGRPFDIRLIDLDGDGLDDIIAGCVTQDDEKPGGVYVWLTRPSN